MRLVMPSSLVLLISLFLLSVSSSASATTAFCKGKDLTGKSSSQSCGTGDSACSGAGGSACGGTTQSTQATEAKNDWNTKCNKHCTEQIDPNGNNDCLADASATNAEKECVDSPTGAGGTQTTYDMHYESNGYCKCKSQKKAKVTTAGDIIEYFNN